MNARVEVDGRPADFEALRALRFGAFGHFTAMQVRDRRTRGLDFHLARLDGANRELFGRPLDGTLVRSRIRHALGSQVDASVRVYAYDDSLVVTVREPGAAPDRPQRLRTVNFRRAVAHLKHSAGWEQEYHRRLVHREGYDEALFTGSDGTISEGAITNLGCWDGSTLVWPDAPALAGITMQVLRREFAAAGVASRLATVRLGDLPGYAAVFVSNARGVAPVSKVDGVDLPIDGDFAHRLAETYDNAPWDPL